MDEPEAPRPLTYAGQPIPEDARRMGLDRNTEEGALLAMAGSLNPAKRSHRLIAWTILVSLTAPLGLNLLWELWRLL